MRLIVNDIALNHSSRGAHRYATGVLAELAWATPVQTTDWARLRRWSRVRELLARGERDAVLWSPAQRGPLRAAHHVVTVLDCINVEYTHVGDWRMRLFRTMFQAVLRNAAGIVTISESTRAAVLRNYDVAPERVIAFAGPTRVLPSSLTSTLPLVATPLTLDIGHQPHVLMVVNALPHKNTARAVRAFLATRARRSGAVLRIVGGVDPAVEPDIAKSDGSVQLTGGVDDDTLSHLMRTCVCLVSPSLDEGLNLPIAETLQHGSMVACSDIAVHREFYDGCVEWFDPLRTDSMTEAIDRCFEHPWPKADIGLPASARGFVEVAADYRHLFLQVADGAVSSA